MKKRSELLSIVLIILLLVMPLAGCNKNNDHVYTPSSNPFDREITDARYRLNHGVIEPDPESQSLIYAGTPVTLTYMMDNEGTAAEWGIVIYVNGFQQPFSIDGSNEVKNCHIINMEEGEKKNCKIQFIPIQGKAGEDFTVYIATILKPSYQVKGDSLDWGYFHSYGQAVPLHLVIEKDVPAQDVDLDCKTLTGEYNEQFPYWAHHSNTTEIEISDGYDAVYAEADRDITLDIAVSGRESLNYRLAIFIDHKLVPALDGNKYYNIATQKDKMLRLKIKLPYSEVKDGKFIYGVLIPLVEEYSITAPPIRKSNTKTILFEKAPTTTPPTYYDGKYSMPTRRPNSDSTSRMSSYAQNTSESTSSETAQNISGLTKIPNVTQTPVPNDAYIIGCYPVKKNQILFKFACGKKFNEPWCGVFDIEQNKYIATLNDYDPSSDVTVLDELICFTNYGDGFEDKHELKSIDLYDHQLRKVKSVSLSNLDTPSAVVSQDGKTIAYLKNEGDSNNIYVCDLDLNNQKIAFKYNSANKSENLDGITKLVQYYNDCVIFNGYEESSKDVPLLGVGLLSLSTNKIDFRSKSNGQVDSRSPYKTMLTGALDFHQAEYDGKAIILDNATGSYSDVTFKNKNESKSCVLSHGGKYILTYLETTPVIRLYDTSNIFCKEWKIPSDSIQGLFDPNHVAIDDAGKKGYIFLKGNCYSFAF